MESLTACSGHLRAIDLQEWNMNIWWHQEKETCVSLWRWYLKRIIVSEFFQAVKRNDVGLKCTSSNKWAKSLTELVLFGSFLRGISVENLRQNDVPWSLITSRWTATRRMPAAVCGPGPSAIQGEAPQSRWKFRMETSYVGANSQSVTWNGNERYTN